jgi:hypothetical protein
MPRASFEAVLRRSLPYLERAEAVLRPRLTPLLSWTGERLIGLALLVLTVVLTLPIPFGNWLPAFSIAIVGLALAEKDGIAVNALWPRTAIATAAVKNLLGGEQAVERCRKPEIMASIRSPVCARSPRCRIRSVPSIICSRVRPVSASGGCGCRWA